MEKYKHIVEKIQTEDLIKFTRDLIKIDSVFDPDVEGANEEEAAQFVYDFLEKEGFDVTMEEVAPGRPNVIARYKGKEGGKTLLFEGHTDVVSIGDIDQWTHDPFGAEIVNVDGKDRIYGRGACDTKNNVAAMIYAAKAIKDSEEDFKGEIILCIPIDEEGMMLGIKHFIAQGHTKGVDGAIICEPEENQLCVAQKGAIRIGITIKGTQCHGCMPLSGNNPNWAVGRIINECRALETFEKDRLGEHEYVGWPSITPTIINTPIKGVAQINVVPSDAYMTLDIRTVPGQDHKAIVRQIQGIIDRFEKQFPDGDDKFKASLEIIDDRPFTETSKDDPVTKSLAKAYRKITGKAERYNGVPGATDGTFIFVAGVPVVVTGAGDREVPHQVDEWCEIDELIETCKLYTLSAMYFLNEEHE